MKNTTLFSIAFAMMILGIQTLVAKDIYVSKQKANSSKEKLVTAYNQAKSGDVILVDIDVIFEESDNPLTINKSNLTFKGKIKNKGKYKLERTNNKNIHLRITGSNITLENLLFTNGTQQVVFGKKEEISIKNSKIINCYFKNGKYTGVDFRGNFENTEIKNTSFENCKFSLQTMDCRILKNFTVDHCIFYKGDHQISLDNPHATNLEHENIVIKNTTFNLSTRFNIALANTQNVTISNCNFAGGTGPYSQALHFEDRTKNVWVVHNKIKCLADVAILLYATDKIGHGTGRRLTEAEKTESGSGNITLDNNTITSGNVDAAISVGYGKGYFKIFGNNTILSKNKGINTFNSKNMHFEIDDKTSIKGKKYSEIKQMETKEKENYIRIK
ncbi:right-handed parallel beta-helix repeat-containing protein [Wenyingzhuangia sp. 2_MG-2023]|uniref:right-handed parallel beta-helix repeat-containing protein n=1 Tax=Wenyingzhuangia sp. 2_MG-2023 TaxID=3062639 RepID=UPI0026E22FEE|nr:right-handed parallel beta-helix repeat-containing protein [Wenyingzhuangia sp. 2_MG-2023]MDO6737330.1 right-handed parallel beta-helix repeat-containing protein [Wenyingzhuangia sp. 2_MG-2023]